MPPKQTTETLKKLMDNRLRLERRNANPMIYARTFLQGKNVVVRTGETSLKPATAVAKDWYLGLLERVRRGEQLHGISFENAVERFLPHAAKERGVSEGQLRNYAHKWNLLKTFFEGVKVKDVDAQFLLNLREARSKATSKTGSLVKPATLKKDMVFIRLVLSYAKEHMKCIPAIPAFPGFAGKWAIRKAGRPYLTLDEWRRVRDLSKQRAGEPDQNPRTRRQREELYWFIMMCVGAALRVGEAYSLRWKDCELTRLSDPERTQALHMWVLGKHSHGEREEAYGLYGAVSAYQEMQKARPDANPDDLLFLESHREGMKELLKLAELRTDAKGRTRDAKSLRQTGISMRLEAVATPDYRDIAKWARTSPAMIHDFYDQTHPESSVKRIVGRRREPHKVTRKSRRRAPVT